MAQIRQVEAEQQEFQAMAVLPEGLIRLAQDLVREQQARQEQEPVARLVQAAQLARALQAPAERLQPEAPVEAPGRLM
jgi:hypothetical protein